MIIDAFICKIFSFLENRKWCYLYSQYFVKYKLPASFKFNGYGISIYGEGDFTAGENSYIGQNCSIQISKGYCCSIGRNCRLAHNIRIYTESTVADINLDINPFDTNKKKKGNVIIGNGVWIGVNVFINPGICIGDNVVIGANSVVTKDLEANPVYGGVPAKLIRKKSVTNEI